MLASRVFTCLFVGFFILFFISIVISPNFLDIAYFIVLCIMLICMKFAKDTDE